MNAAGSGALTRVRLLQMVRDTFFWFEVDSAQPGAPPLPWGSGRLASPTELSASGNSDLIDLIPEGRSGGQPSTSVGSGNPLAPQVTAVCTLFKVFGPLRIQ